MQIPHLENKPMLIDTGHKEEKPGSCGSSARTGFGIRPGL